MFQFRILSLDETLQQLLQDKAPVETIRAKFNSSSRNSKESNHQLICYAVHCGHKEMVQQLMQIVYDKTYELKPLISAANTGDIEMVDMLLE